jgi:predicted N-acetyltransferase YhbS
MPGPRGSTEAAVCMCDRTSLFDVGSLRAVELGAGDIPALQHFFETNPEYFLNATGQPPAADEALHELQDEPPPDVTLSRTWPLGVVDDAGALVAMTNVASDFMAEGVWLIGLFIVASPLHGTGTSAAVCRALESWIRGRGARWIRLAVVAGDAKPERFWPKVGYADVRRRSGVEMGRRVNTLRIMVKALAGGGVADYLELVARDRPDVP